MTLDAVASKLTLQFLKHLCGLSRNVSQTIWRILSLSINSKYIHYNIPLMRTQVNGFLLFSHRALQLLDLLLKIGRILVESCRLQSFASSESVPPFARRCNLSG